MTFSTHFPAAAVALGLSLTSSAAFAAHANGWFDCQTWKPTKTSPVDIHCLTATKDGRARMRAAPCDPAKMSMREMQARCAELSAGTVPAPAPKG